MQVVGATQGKSNIHHDWVPSCLPATVRELPYYCEKRAQYSIYARLGRKDSRRVCEFGEFTDYKRRASIVCETASNKIHRRPVFR